MPVASSEFLEHHEIAPIPRAVSGDKDRAWFDVVNETKVRIVMSSGGLGLVQEPEKDDKDKQARTLWALRELFSRFVAV